MVAAGSSSSLLAVEADRLRALLVDAGMVGFVLGGGKMENGWRQKIPVRRTERAAAIHILRLVVCIRPAETITSCR